MPIPTATYCTPSLTLTERGRVRAILVQLEERWPDLTLGEQGRALELLDESAATYRRRTQHPTALRPVTA